MARWSSTRALFYPDRMKLFRLPRFIGVVLLAVGVIPAFGVWGAMDRPTDLAVLLGVDKEFGACGLASHLSTGPRFNVVVRTD